MILNTFPELFPLPLHQSTGKTSEMGKTRIDRHQKPSWDGMTRSPSLRRDGLLRRRAEKEAGA